jgi:hypothetical protein
LYVAGQKRGWYPRKAGPASTGAASKEQKTKGSGSTAPRTGVGAAGSATGATRTMSASFPSWKLRLMRLADNGSAGQPTGVTWANGGKAIRINEAAYNEARSKASVDAFENCRMQQASTLIKEVSRCVRLNYPVNAVPMFCVPCSSHATALCPRRVAHLRRVMSGPQVILISFNMIGPS